MLELNRNTKIYFYVLDLINCRTYIYSTRVRIRTRVRLSFFLTHTVHNTATANQNTAHFNVWLPWQPITNTMVTMKTENMQLCHHIFLSW